jgi:transcriptional regulator with XRE-family HTH domain
MAQKQSSPEIRCAAFSAAREKRALSVEQLALLACLSKKQIQQIENGQSNSFYSPAIKLVAAKKVAKLIQLDEKDAFDFGPQAELPLTQADELTPGESSVAESPPLIDEVKAAEQSDASKPASPDSAIEVVRLKEDEPNEAKKAAGRKRKSDLASPAISEPNAKPVLVEPEPEPNKRVLFAAREQKHVGKKWVWLLPVGALVLALVQFQPLLEDQLDAWMGKPKQAELTALTATPVDTEPASPPPAEPVGTTPAVTPQASPVVIPNPAANPSPAIVVAANSACPPIDASIENYKSPAASKPGNMVYVKMPTAQVICVEDGDGKVQSKAMEPGLGHSFYGKPPFKLLTSGLSSAEVFFQGFRVRPSNADSKSIVLVQAD